MGFDRHLGAFTGHISESTETAPRLVIVKQRLKSNISQAGMGKAGSQPKPLHISPHKEPHIVCHGQYPVGCAL